MRSVSAALALLIAAPALAQDAGDVGSADVFAVRDIAVDESAESAVAAQRNARIKGNRIAIERLLRRLTAAVDHPRLPQFDDQAVAELIEDFAVRDEKSSSTRYLASLTVRFKRDAVRALFSRVGISHSETRARPILIVPVLERNGNRLLFDVGNVWFAAWSALRLDQGSLMPLRLPLGDLQDLTTLSAEAALSGDAGVFANLAERYGAERVMVAHARMRIDFAANGRLRLDITQHRFDNGGAGTEIASVLGNEGETESDLMRRAALQTATGMIEGWKRATTLQAGTAIALSARLKVGDIRELVEIRRRLRDNAIVRHVAIERVEPGDLQLSLLLAGDVEQAKVSLAQDGLDLLRQGDFWLLRRRVSGP